LKTKTELEALFLKQELETSEECSTEIERLPDREVVAEVWSGEDGPALAKLMAAAPFMVKVLLAVQRSQLLGKGPLSGAVDRALEKAGL
jgi:hypothetical protein